MNNFEFKKVSHHPEFKPWNLISASGYHSNVAFMLPHLEHFLYLLTNLIFLEKFPPPPKKKIYYYSVSF